MSEQMTAEESAAMAAMAAEPVEMIEAEPEPQEAPPQQAVEPEPEHSEAEPDAKKPPPGYVPIEALHESRARQKELKAQFEALAAQVEALKSPPAPPPEIKVPDPILDPQGFKAFQVEQIKRQAEELARIERQHQEGLQQQAVMQRLASDVNQFRAQTPDYDSALQYAVKVRRDELAMFGNPPEVIDQQLEVDMQAIVAQAYSQGRNPAEMFYGYAKTRGYTPAAPAVPQPSQAAAQVNALADAQRKAQSMGTVGGPSNDGGITLETLSKMSEAELAALPKAKRDEYMQRVMGG